MAQVAIPEKRNVETTPAQEYESEQMQMSPVLTFQEGDLLKALGDEHTRTILMSLIDDAKSVIDIARERNIPISSVYRKIHWLKKAHLVRVNGIVITGDGKKYHLYSSRIKSADISLTTSAIRVNFATNRVRSNDTLVQ